MTTPTDTPRRYMTVVYEITDETEWRKTNPLRYAHNGLKAVGVAVDDILLDLLDQAEAEVERLRSTMRSFVDFMDENLGTTADWPMEAAFDNEETCQRHCDHLNAMKRLVKPEAITPNSPTA